MNKSLVSSRMVGTFITCFMYLQFNQSLYTTLLGHKPKQPKL